MTRLKRLVLLALVPAVLTAAAIYREIRSPLREVDARLTELEANRRRLLVIVEEVEGYRRMKQGLETRVALIESLRLQSNATQLAPRILASLAAGSDRVEEVWIGGGMIGIRGRARSLSAVNRLGGTLLERGLVRGFDVRRFAEAGASAGGPSAARFAILGELNEAPRRAAPLRR